MAKGIDQNNLRRVMILTDESVGLRLMQAQDAPTIAQWNQDLEFTR